MTISDDAASILFPNDKPASAPRAPDWYQAEHTAAEQRLMGSHGRKEGAEAGDQPPAGDDQDDDAASTLFKEDATPDLKAYETTMRGELDSYTLTAMQDGQTERAEELKGAIAGLTQDFARHGTDRQEIQEAIRLMKPDSLELPTEDVIRSEYQQRLAELPEMGITNDDLRIARQLIADLDRTAAPGLIDQLRITGKGNDPKLIQAAIREAKRRKYR